jgi:hypothetical protein
LAEGAGLGELKPKPDQEIRIAPALGPKSVGPIRKTELGMAVRRCSLKGGEFSKTAWHGLCFILFQI